MQPTPRRTIVATVSALTGRADVGEEPYGLAGRFYLQPQWELGWIERCLEAGLIVVREEAGHLVVLRDAWNVTPRGMGSTLPAEQLAPTVEAATAAWRSVAWRRLPEAPTPGTRRLITGDPSEPAGGSW